MCVYLFRSLVLVHSRLMCECVNVQVCKYVSMLVCMCNFFSTGTLGTLCIGKQSLYKIKQKMKIEYELHAQRKKPTIETSSMLLSLYRLLQFGTVVIVVAVLYVQCAHFSSISIFHYLTKRKKNITPNL